MMFTDREKGLLYSLQRGLPLVPRPLESIGAEYGCTEQDVADFIERLLSDGSGRRLGGVFDSRRLGYRSILCAVSLPDAAAVETAAAAVIPHPGVTHCYERGWPDGLDSNAPGGPKGRHAPNLWFTMAALHSHFNHALQALRASVSTAELLVLPALTRFKIDVVFDPRTRDRDEQVPGVSAESGASVRTDESPPEFSQQERAVVRLLAGSLPPSPGIFLHAARALGMDQAELLTLLRNWRERGILRRVALIVRHGEVGFKANAMCVWHVPKPDLPEAGRRLAACPDVTHCYERPALPAFPWNLYAMIHASDWPGVCGIFAELSEIVGERDGQMLCSLREFKKTSMQYFSDEEHRA